MKYIELEGWTGRAYYPVDIVGSTPLRYRVRICVPGGINLPGRFIAPGETTLVPKRAVVEQPDSSPRCIQTPQRRF